MKLLTSGIQCLIHSFDTLGAPEQTRAFLFKYILTLTLLSNKQTELTNFAIKEIDRYDIFQVANLWELEECGGWSNRMGMEWEWESNIKRNIFISIELSVMLTRIINSSKAACIILEWRYAI